MAPGVNEILLIGVLLTVFLFFCGTLFVMHKYIK